LLSASWPSRCACCQSFWWLLHFAWRCRQSHSLTSPLIRLCTSSRGNVSRSVRSENVQWPSPLIFLTPAVPRLAHIYPAPRPLRHQPLSSTSSQPRCPSQGASCGSADGAHLAQNAPALAGPEATEKPFPLQAACWGLDQGVQSLCKIPLHPGGWVEV
jgi:hypothetical protein